MNKAAMMQWTEDIWEPIMEKDENAPAILVLDAAAAHSKSNAQQELANLNTVLVIVLGGHTSKLQTVDVGTNEPWKDQVRCAIEDWSFDQPAGTKPNC